MNTNDTNHIELTEHDLSILRDNIDINVKFDNIEDYYFHVFLSLYKKNQIMSASKASWGNFRYQSSFSYRKLNSNLFWILPKISSYEKFFTSDISKIQNFDNFFPTNIDSAFSGYTFNSNNITHDEQESIYDILKNNLFPRKKYFLSYSHIYSNDRIPFSVIQKIAICTFIEQEHFSKILFKTQLKSSFTQLFDAENNIQELKHLSLLLGHKENHFFDYLFQNKIIKSLTLNISNIALDGREQDFLEFLLPLPDKYKEIYVNYLIKKSTDKEKLILQKLTNHQLFPSHLKDIAKTGFSSVSIDASLNSLESPKSLVELASCEKSISYFFDAAIPMPNVYAFYKKLFLKKNFPLKENYISIFREQIGNCILKLSLSIKKGHPSTDYLFFEVQVSAPEKFCEEALKLNKLIEKQYVYLFDSLMIKSHENLITKGITDYFQNNTLLAKDIQLFFKTVREHDLNNALATNETATPIKKKI